MKSSGENPSYALDPLVARAGCFFTEVAIGRLTRYLQRRGYPIVAKNLDKWGHLPKPLALTYAR